MQESVDENIHIHTVNKTSVDCSRSDGKRLANYYTQHFHNTKTHVSINWNKRTGLRRHINDNFAVIDLKFELINEKPHFENVHLAYHTAVDRLR